MDILSFSTGILLGLLNMLLFIYIQNYILKDKRKKKSRGLSALLKKLSGVLSVLLYLGRYFLIGMIFLLLIHGGKQDSFGLAMGITFFQFFLFKFIVINKALKLERKVTK